MAPAYIIVDMLISDMEQYRQYMAAAPAAAGDGPRVEVRKEGNQQCYQRCDATHQ